MRVGAERRHTARWRGRGSRKDRGSRILRPTAIQMCRMKPKWRGSLRSGIGKRFESMPLSVRGCVGPRGACRGVERTLRLGCCMSYSKAMRYPERVAYLFSRLEEVRQTHEILGGRTYTRRKLRRSGSGKRCSVAARSFKEGSLRRRAACARAALNEAMKRAMGPLLLVCRRRG